MFIKDWLDERDVYEGGIRIIVSFDVRGWSGNKKEVNKKRYVFLVY